MRQLIVISLVIVCTLAAVAQYPVKVGEPLVIDLGAYIRTWERQRKGFPKETLRFCEEPKRQTDKTCTYFTDETGKPSGSKAVVYENGTLVFDSFTQDDAGSYFSDDEPSRVSQNADGSYWSLPRSLINVFTTDA